MIIDQTKDIKFKTQYYLYWIRKPEHTNISTQGYVGVTLNPTSRLRAHNQALSSEKGRKNQGYSEKFIEAYLEGDLLFSVIDCGSAHEMENNEYLLRPKQDIGFNKRIGGFSQSKPRVKDLRSSNPILYRVYKSLLQYCEDKKLPVDFNFKTDCGFRLFHLHIDDKRLSKKSGFKLHNEELGFVLGNFSVVDSNVNNDHSKWVFWDNRWWSKREACGYNGVNIKTADKRITKYKMTREEAVGFKPFLQKCFDVVILDGVECKYDKKKSNFTKDELIELYNFYKTGDRGFKKMCDEKGIVASNMMRYFKRYGLESKKDRRSKEFRQEVGKVNYD